MTQDPAAGPADRPGPGAGPAPAAVSTTGGGEMTLDATFQDVLAASSVLDELPDSARVDAWASSVLGVWAEDPDAAAIDAELVEWLEASDDPRAQPVLDAVTGLLRPRDGAAVATRAWSVSDRGDQAVGIGFALADGSQHSLLVDIVDGAIASLVVAPGPDDLLAGADRVVAPEPMAVADAAAAIVAAWDGLRDQGLAPPEDAWVNGALARARLQPLVDVDVSQLGRAPSPVPVAPEDESTRRERAELNAWALSVLDAAGLGSGSAAPPLLVDPLDPDRARAYPAAEREAFTALEWADWIGAVVGLSRLGAGTLVEPTMLVDQVNRCPEVTSSIPKRDRPYYEWAFSLVLPLWRAAGVLDAEHRLTTTGAAMLVGALREAWRPARL